MYEIEIDEIVERLEDRKISDVGCRWKILQTLPDTFEKWGTEFSEDAARWRG